MVPPGIFYYRKDNGSARIRGWRILGENHWRIVGENPWRSVGENTWRTVGENLWRIIGRKLTPADHPDFRELNKSWYDAKVRTREVI